MKMKMKMKMIEKDDFIMKVWYCKYIPCHKKELNLEYRWYYYNTVPNALNSAINECIRTHNYEFFIRIRNVANKWFEICNNNNKKNMLLGYLPSTALVYNESDYNFKEVNILKKENFDKIVCVEYKRGN